MTTGLHVTHKFVSAKADGADNTLVKPSNWNDDHGLVMDSGFVLGNQSGSNGPVEQIPCSSAAATMLSQADIASILAYLGVRASKTGDAQLTLQSTADAGWVMMDDGTIGNASSGASTRAAADTSDLFTLLYALADADVPLFTSSGAATTRTAQGSAATAFANSCSVSLPLQLGRSFIVAGAGVGLTSRALASSVGQETTTLEQSDLPNVNQAITVNDPHHSHAVSPSGATVGVGGQNYGLNDTPAPHGDYALSIIAAATGITASFHLNGNVTQTTPTNMQPSTAWNVMLKL